MQDIFGNIPLPSPLAGFGDVEAGGIGIFLNRILQILIIIAGYSFLSAGDDPKKVAGAWQKIWQTLLGLAFAAGAFVLAAIFGQLIFGNPFFILKPEIPTL